VWDRFAYCEYNHVDMTKLQQLGPVSGLCPLHGILTRKHVSETDFIPPGEERESPTQLGPLERYHQWLVPMFSSSVPRRSTTLHGVRFRLYKYWHTVKTMFTQILKSATKPALLYRDFIKAAVNRNQVLYLFSLFHSHHYMFRPVRVIFRLNTIVS
jgi:hypothetical protein